MKVGLSVFVGLCLFFGWIAFWFNANDKHNWPFWVCFPMAAFVPVSVAVAIVVRYDL